MVCAGLPKSLKITGLKKSSNQGTPKGSQFSKWGACKKSKIIPLN